MKRVRNVLLFAVVVCLVALPNLLFVGCSCDSGKSITNGINLNINNSIRNVRCIANSKANRL
ncbi:MAG TPA: hypothetical protein PKV16_03585 [Caldisericia bacterium]|nr:hypothetical protein [Caldisericia bacterium]HPF48393.1 hypothetical protein [Caldisericia bacterium]HPI83427.1 hypothetical protein [Caldisericia bacterium]HPQ92847.1 hypothetical protein [Caldisericia bacterium]HRV74055.1 hypothetical protein [Caldisericia bacterium]